MCCLLQHLHPSRVLPTAYNGMYMVVVFACFFGGPNVWPNKRARLLTGYGLFVFALAVPPLVSSAMGAKSSSSSSSSKGSGGN
jgi:hypothetical protein